MFEKEMLDGLSREEYSFVDVVGDDEPIVRNMEAMVGSFQ